MEFRELTREEAATLPDEAFTLGIPSPDSRFVGLIDGDGRIYASFILMPILHIESWWQDPATRGDQNIKRGLLSKLKGWVLKNGFDGWLSIATTPAIDRLHRMLGGKQIVGAITYFDATDSIFKE